VSSRLSELGADTEVALITFTDSDGLARYLAANEPPFPVLLDGDRVSYRAYGLGRGSVARVWGPAAARRYLQIFRSDGLRGLTGWRPPTEDSLQLGGDFVVDGQGRLIYGHWGAGPDDRPDVDELIAAAAAAGGARR
jgi:hypothetical protein